MFSSFQPVARILQITLLGLPLSYLGNRGEYLFNLHLPCREGLRHNRLKTLGMAAAFEIGCYQSR
jgi:hypothetical protein